MSSIGIVEGFFGPQWSHESRLNYASFLSSIPKSFYFYAPKRDPHLRKEWRADWGPEYLNRLNILKVNFQKQGVEFGVGLSPFGLGTSLNAIDRELLKNKISSLNDLGIDKLGLFFDDMPSSDHLASVQAEVVELARNYFSKNLMFCPSYYTYDPILDKVFGQRPAGYLEQIADSISQEVSLLWTGPKVISDEITHEHLAEVRTLLKRKPFIWENIYANDGPRNCKFLKLKQFRGRDSRFLDDIEGIAFNLMNQPYLSQILFKSSELVLKEACDPARALEKSVELLVDPRTGKLLLTHLDLFLNQGLDKIEIRLKEQLAAEFLSGNDYVGKEISDWLRGEYLVGPECLTD